MTELSLTPAQVSGYLSRSQNTKWLDSPIVRNPAGRSASNRVSFSGSSLA